MATFDFEKYDVIGFVQKPGFNKDYSTITVMGIIDSSDNAFTPLPASERQTLFPTKGCIFAYNMYSKHPDWTEQCVRIKVKPNTNTRALDNRDDFVWDWSSFDSIFAEKAIVLNGRLGENGEDNHQLLKAAGVLDSDETKYVISGENLYEVTPATRLIPYWRMSDVSGSLLKCEGNYFVYGRISVKERGKIDLTTDAQLIEWYKKNILKKEWAKIHDAGSFAAVDDLVKECLQKVNNPANVIESRLSRITAINHNVDLTFEELEDLGTSQWFKDSVQEAVDKSIEDYILRLTGSRKDAINNLRKELEDEKQRLNEEHGRKLKEKEAWVNGEIKKLDEIITGKNDKISELEEAISRKTRESDKILNNAREELEKVKENIRTGNELLEKIEAKKESIVEDFGVIREVLGTCGASGNSKLPNIRIEEFNSGASDAYPVIQPFRKNLESRLILYGAGRLSLDEIIARLSKNDILLLPDGKAVRSLIEATGRCRYVVEYVGVDWKSFDDLWACGLAALVDSCRKNADTVHYLVLRNINMSFIPAYLQPVFDMESGLSSVFPGTDIGFPENLKILCTRSAERVIPLSENVLADFGCVSPSEEKVTPTLDNTRTFPGYLTPSMMADLISSREIANSIDSYLDD